MSERWIATLLLAVSALTFWAASAIHFGLTIPLGSETVSDSFEGAAVPEAVVGAVVAVGAASLLGTRRRSRTIAIATATFAILLTLYGLSVTVRGGRMLDVAYHLSVLAALGAALGVLLRDRSGYQPG